MYKTIRSNLERKNFCWPAYRVPGRQWANRLCCALATLCLATLFLPPPQATAQQGKKATILSINDVYIINGTDDGKTGGLARVRALRAEIAETAPEHLFLLAGDFLSPSLLGRTYKGAQMLDLLNVMDGNLRPGTFDPRMFVTFGNHEFDDSSCKDGGPLLELVNKSEFAWLASNLDFSKCGKLGQLAHSREIVSSKVVESGGLRVGLYGLTLKKKDYAAAYEDYATASCRQVRMLRQQGVDAVVALTHLNRPDDLRLLGIGVDGKPPAETERPCAETPDLVVGGHDHTSLASRKPNLFKADSDAASAWKIEIFKDGVGELQIDSELIHLREGRKPDPQTQRLIDMWLLRHDERFCAMDCANIARFRTCAKSDEPDACWAKLEEQHKSCLAQVHEGACLKGVLTRAASLLEAEELTNRGQETGFGDWLADQVRRTAEADVAFLNAGGIRLNYNIKPGADIIRRHMETMFPFKNKLIVREVPGGELWRAMEFAVKNRGTGKWAHISGFAVRLQAGDEPIAKMLLKRADGTVVVIGKDSTERVKIAAGSYVLAGRDGHGFDSVCSDPGDRKQCEKDLAKDPRWPGADGELSALAGARMKKDGYDLRPGNLPDGRICSAVEKDCLVHKWESQ